MEPSVSLPALGMCRFLYSFGFTTTIRLCRTDEAFKASAQLAETLFDPKLGKSEEPNETALNKAFGTEVPVWEWFEQPSNASRLLRFGITMEGSKQAAPPDAILHGEYNSSGICAPF